MNISMVYDYLYICVLMFTLLLIYLLQTLSPQLSGLSVDNSLCCWRMTSPTRFCLLHQIIHSLDTAFCYSATLTSLDSATNSEYLNSSLTCISAVQISTRVISTPL